MDWAGYPKLKGQLPEMHFTPLEEQMAQICRKGLEDRFFILWSLSGSSFHKLYPWAPYVAGELNKNFRKEICIVTVGDHLCRILEWQNDSTVNRSGHWTIRQSMLMTKYADLVIGPETGILNAAACYDTPKIVFLSHSSQENLTKYWKKCTSLHSDKAKCYPCHRLMYTDCCPKGPMKAAAKCMETLDPKMVYEAILVRFNKWKDKRNDCVRSLSNQHTR